MSKGHASPSIPHEGLEILAEVLAVDVASTTVAGQDVVGSLAVANDRGVLLHPDVTADEAMLIEEVLGVKPMVGTVSSGSPYVGAGVFPTREPSVEHKPRDRNSIGLKMPWASLNRPSV